MTELLGITLKNDPSCWELHVNDFNYSKEQLTLLFDILMSAFKYGIEVWVSAHEKKYLDRIDKFLRRAHRYGYSTKSVQIIDVVKERDTSLFEKIYSNPDHPLHKW